MPRIGIRSAVPADLPLLVALDHSYETTHVWQMDINSTEGQSDIHFRETRLPRSVPIAYPRSPALLLDDWMRRSALLVGIVDALPVAYISLAEGIAVSTSWVTDLVVNRPYRRQKIGTTLLLAAQDWAKDRNNTRVVVEMQSKNTPAIHMALQMGYQFCGYNDHYYANQDIAIFFAQYLR
ncbi:MAG: GNAT family N-acetyltransferase [Anaerolineaceae bacterium]|nr:GNAT family N-acetyltransferase [Anaerolineaceae bacterium]MBN2676722.1 GNAT family N-acetyltransferase [Anaerolineaceae bacterium]